MAFRLLRDKDRPGAGTPPRRAAAAPPGAAEQPLVVNGGHVPVAERGGGQRGGEGGGMAGLGSFSYGRVKNNGAARGLLYRCVMV